MKGWLLPGVLLAVVFAASRVPALALQAHDSDVNLYARYAAEHQAAERRGQSFYELHRQRAQDGSAEYRSVEYPPLAVTFMTLPTRLIESPFDTEFPTGLQSRYTRAYVWMMAGIDAAVLLLVVFLVRRLYPTETPFAQLERCLVYVVCTWPLYGVLYARLDLGVAVLVTAALALLVGRLHWCLSLAVLTVAVHFKLMPIVLAPLWLAASLPAAALRWPWREVARALVARAGVLAGFGLALLAPYYIRHGPAVLEFLDYHKDRGLEIESTWASLLLPLKAFGGDFELYHSHGSVNVHSSWAPLLTALATPVLAGLLAVATGLFVGKVRQLQIAERAEGMIAQKWPRLVVGFTFLLLMVSIVANKVFSPQYLLWVLPLVPLLDLPVGRRRMIYAATFAVCFLTMRIFPDCFLGDIVQVAPPGSATSIFGGPTAYGAFLLLTRNAMCVGLTVFVAATFGRDLKSPSLDGLCVRA